MSQPRLPSGRLACGPNGAVAAGHPLAATAGLRMLEAGGTAVDACLAAAFAAWVVMPDMCGLGGDLFMLSRAADGTVTAITGGGPAPAAGYPPRTEARATLALVPGAAAALDRLRETQATLPLDMLLAPAIRLAREGFVISAMLARKIEGLPADRFSDELLAGWGGVVPRAGAVVRWPALAQSLHRLATAKSARELLFDALPEWQARGVLLRPEDIAGYTVTSEAPLRMNIGGWTVFGQPPMSQAVATLGALGRAGIDAVIESDDVFRTHMLIEGYKRAFAHFDDFGHAGDIAAVCRRLLDPAAARAEREAIGPQASEGPPLQRNYGETTQCAAVDRSGATVSLIHSLYRPFGARVLSPRTGLIANDRGASFTAGANAPAAGQRPRHTLVNLLALAPDGAIFALGTPGAQAQTQTTLQVLASLIARPEALVEAVGHPRWSFIGGKRVACEADLDEAMLQALARHGHEIALRPPRDWLMGSVSLAAYRDGLCYAVADDRRDALALAT